MSHNELPEFFYEIFDASLPRLGPGNDLCTQKALDMLGLTHQQRVNEAESKQLRILDVGCGNGAQTIQLAKHLNGTILALDNRQPFLDELQRRAELECVSGKIRLCCQNMCNLELEDSTFDLIWSESSIFIIGFEQGLKTWRRFLVPGGLFGVSEMCWLKPDPPQECVQYFASVYPAMMSIDSSVKTIMSCGYDLISHFTFPESAWLDSFYVPLEERLRMLRRKHFAVANKTVLIDAIQEEIEIYRKYSEYYGYEFFLMRKG